MRNSIVAKIAGVTLLLAVPSVTLVWGGGPGARIWHFGNGDSLTLVAVHPETGDIVEVTGTTTRGDFIRRNQNGTYFASLGIRGTATFDIAATDGGPEYTGTGMYQFDGSVDVADPENPLAGFTLTLRRSSLHVRANLVDSEGASWGLSIQAIARNGEYRRFRAVFEPISEK